MGAIVTYSEHTQLSGRFGGDATRQREKNLPRPHARVMGLSMKQILKYMKQQQTTSQVRY